MADMSMVALRAKVEREIDKAGSMAALGRRWNCSYQSIQQFRNGALPSLRMLIALNLEPIETIKYRYRVRVK